MQRHRPPGGTAGFTLIEILVVIAIIGLLTGLVATNVVSHYQRARLETARSDTAQILAAARTYWIRNNRAPSMQDLVEPPPELDGYDGVPLDPWDREYELRTPPELHEWEVVSAGPDHEFGTEDDITSRSARRQKG
ncbi:MAG: type II secretion system protein GspG [Planctomycetes bacterium]|nr:type II secretion system protein GspG [Planctomycetota bacterium]